MRKRNIFVTILACMLSTGVYAQQMSLKDLFNIAEENSEQLRINRTAVSSAEEGIKSAKAAKLPEVGVEVSIGYLGDGKLGDRDFSDWQHIDNPHFMNNFAVKASQVIYTGGAIKSGIRLAELGKDMAELSLQNNRQEVRFVITGQYLDICRLQNQRRVIEENIALTDTIIANTKVRVAQGTALDNDITRYELQRENLLLEKRRLSDALDILRHQLGTTLHTDLTGVEFSIDGNIASTLASRSENDWQSDALQGNVGLKQAEKAINISEQQLKLKKSDLLPKVAVIAENHFDGPITIEVPVIDKNFNYWFAGIGVQYQLSSLWKSKKDVNKARIDVRQAQEQRNLAQEGINRAVQAAYTNLLTSESELNMRQKSVQLALEHYDVTYNRYNNGLCLLTDMLDAASTRLSSETALVNARIDIIYNYYQLKYLTSSL